MYDYEVFLIDLDDTLYPKSNGIWQMISERINRYLVDRLEISLEEAQELRQHYLDTYGTTLSGLIYHHDIDPEDYLEFVHDVPIENMIQPDPELKEILMQLNPKRFIFTNGSIQHANRILRHLDLEDLFDGIIDILALEFHNKPQKTAYQRALSLAGNPNPEKCMLIDDRIANLIPAKTLKMTTILVGDDIQDPAVDYSIPSIKEIIKLVPGLSQIPPGRNNHGSG